MLRDSIKEIRYHPGRFLATLVAIAISVGFLAAISIFVASVTNALGQQSSLPTTKADIVVSTDDKLDRTTEASAAELLTKIKAVPGVEAAEGIYQTDASVTGPSRSEYVRFLGVPDEQFRWTSPTQGRWPTTQTEIALSQRVLDRIGAKVGDTVTINEQKVTVVGATNDPSSMFGGYGYVAKPPTTAGDSENPAPEPSLFVIKLKPGADAATVQQQLDTQAVPFAMHAKLAADYKQDALASFTRDFNALKYILWVFGVIALVVGIITIANTFAILLVQRRRQIGLLRAVGASGSQVRGRFLVEAALLGLIGSILGLLLGAGIAAIGMVATKSMWAGLVAPWPELLIEIAVGVLATVVAAFVPSIRATRVHPLEALQPVATAEAARRASIVRLVFCLVLIAIGAACTAVALTTKKLNIVWALGAGVTLSVGVLVGATFIIPWIIKGVGALLQRTGATSRLAVLNALRNPKRTAATATALMLAVGLIVTLQVGLASVRATATDSIERAYPLDLTFTFAQGGGNPNGPRTEPATHLPDDLLTRVKGWPEVQSAVSLQGGFLAPEMDASTPPTEPTGLSYVPVVVPNAQIASITKIVPQTIADNEIWVHPEQRDVQGAKLTDGMSITVQGVSGPVTLKVRTSNAMEGVAMVSATTLPKLVKPTGTMAVWVKLKPDVDIASVYTNVGKIPELQTGTVYPGGGALIKYAVNMVIGILVTVLTALMGVAVVVALVGVANTLGLSVLERTRESALLRAMGMQRLSLRAMLLIEALVITLVGVLVGVVAGAFFAWLGITAVFKQMNSTDPTVFAVDWPLTLAMIAVAALAAALASIIPGHKAATAPPTEALAAE